MNLTRLAFLLIFSVQPLLAQDRDPQLNIAGYEEIIGRYRYYKPDSAIYFAKEGLRYARLTRDSIAVARMLNQLGMIDDNLGKYNDARKKYLTALDLYTQSGNLKGMATETIRLGVIELRKGNYDKAIGYFLQALKISERDNNQPGMMESYLTLAEGYMGQRKYDTALKYLEVAEKLNDKLPFTSLSLNIYNNFGVIYRETGDFKQAETYLRKGIQLSNKPQLQGLNITLTNSLAALYLKKGDRETSVRLQKTALQKAREIRNYLRELQIMISLADTYGQKDPAASFSLLEQALVLAKEKNAYKQEIDLLGRLGRYYRDQGNYREAFRMKEQEHALADSFFYRGMSAEISNLQAEYELDKSKASVRELTYLNSRQQLERNIILGVAVGIMALLGVVAIFYYRTRKLNDQLNEVNSRLSESNTVKDKLFSVLGHDLRSPMSSIISLLYLVNEDDLTAEERKEVISKLAATSTASLETLNKLLKWGEMQIKGTLLNPVPFYPKEIVTRTIALLSNAAEKKSIEVTNEVKSTDTLYSDPDHFEFVVRNLVSNAIKFTSTGGKVVIRTTENRKGFLTFHVRDNGVGISADRLPSIFSLSNISTKGTNNEKGTSLGLVMCKEFVEANQGMIGVVSELGRGTEFWFSLKRWG